MLCAEEAVLLSEQNKLGACVSNAMAHLATLTADLKNSRQTYFKSQAEKANHLTILSQTAGITKSEDTPIQFNLDRLQINKILISQALSKNNGIFNKDIMIGLQKSDPVLRQIIFNLHNSPEEMQDKGFQLQNGILYKQGKSFGYSYLRLCLPQEICKDIIYKMHPLKNMPFSAGTTQVIYLANFHCSQM